MQNNLLKEGFPDGLIVPEIQEQLSPSPADILLGIYNTYEAGGLRGGAEKAPWILVSSHTKFPLKKNIKKGIGMCRY